MGSLAAAEVQAFLKRLGELYSRPGTLYLLGGGALCLLGSPRRTLDIDYSTTAEDLEAAIEQLAAEMQLELEAVPIEEFIPLPSGASSRHHWIGRFSNLAVYVYDPYSIALSKVARGFEADLKDVLFLLQKGLIDLEQLNECVQAALPDAWEFDIAPAELREHFAEIRRLFSEES